MKSGSLNYRILYQMDKHLRKVLFLIVIVLIPLTNSMGQDPQFSQFYAAPLYLSPSFAGSSGGSRVVLNFRDQWPKLPGDYITYSFSFDHFLEDYNSGVGLLFSRDQAGGGLFNTTNIGAQYSYNFNVTRNWHIRPGIHFYYYQRNINFNKLTFNDQISRDFISPTSVDLDRLTTADKVRHLDIASSVLVYSENYWFGFTVDHLMSVSSTLYDEGGYLPIKYSIFGGGKYVVSGMTRSKSERSISGAFNFLKQSEYYYLDLGAYYIKSPLLFGLWYRGVPIFPDNPNTGALTILFGYRIGDLSIGYSYDFTLSRLVTRTGGAHEISLSYGFSPLNVKRKKGAIPCPILPVR